MRLRARAVSAQRVLDSKQNVLVFPGGSKEIFATNPHSKETLLLVPERVRVCECAACERENEMKVSHNLVGLAARC